MNFLLKAVDIFGAGVLWIGGAILAVLAVLTGAAGIAVSIVTSLAVPAFCIIAAWGILKYFGVL
jgi:hypothetical protein